MSKVGHEAGATMEMNRYEIDRRKYILWLWR